MAEGWQTLSDYYNPLDAAAKAEQINADKMQNRIRAIALADEMRERQKRAQTMQALENLPPNPLLAPNQSQMAPQPTPTMPQTPTPGPISGPISPAPSGGMAPGQQTPQMPQITPEQQTVARGDKIISSYSPIMEKAFSSLSSDPTQADILNKLNASAQNNPDVKAALNAKNIDSYEIGADPKTGTAWNRITKDYTQEELDAIANNPKLKGAGVVRGLPPGKYTIELDPLNEYAIRGVTSVKTGMLSDKNLTEEQLINIAQHSKDSSMRTQAREVLDEKRRSELEKVRATATTRQGVTNESAFSTWSPEDKEWWFQTKRDTGESPRFGFGDRKSYSQFNQEYAKWAQRKGISGAEAKTTGATFQALASSLKNQQKVESMMASFVRNLDFQTDKLNKYIPELTRFNARILNVPLRQAAMMIKGSPQESILAMYLTDISNDAAKLSTGSSASVAELSQSAQDRWAKIHDPNLSIKDLMRVVAETQSAAHGRIQSAKDEIESTKSEMAKGGMKARNDEWMEALPDPRQNMGRVIVDDQGNRLESDGTTWRKI
jgi:hypothetical protein